MRPTDENQDGSTRPDLLSGGRRRCADDDNILARLERDSARQALGNRSRAAWHAAAAALVLLLLFAVAWIVFQTVMTPRVAPPTRAPVGLAPATAAVADTMPVRAAAATGLPPLVLLDGARATVAPPAPAVRVPPTEPPAPPVTARSHVAPTPTVRAAPRTAAAARPRKLAVDNIAPDALADTDVALLSAIIIHDSAHAAEKAQLEAAAACARASGQHCGHKASATP